MGRQKDPWEEITAEGNMNTIIKNICVCKIKNKMYYLVQLMHAYIKQGLIMKS